MAMADLAMASMHLKEFQIEVIGLKKDVTRWQDEDTWLKDELA